ncbi:cAMP-dependent protein kinase inhibitor beta [Manis javanica]|nr:cAMP-dependent protein kinase inhibitor beta [Manis javanica]
MLGPTLTLEDREMDDLSGILSSPGAVEAAGARVRVAALGHREAGLAEREGTRHGGQLCTRLGSRKDRGVAMRTDSPKMTDVEAVVNNFASSARAGRRNAVPDIQGSAATGGTSELPLKLEDLSVKEDVKKKDEETAQSPSEKPQNEGK